MNEQVLSTARVYQGRVVHLRVDEVELPGGARARREVVEHAGSVAVLPLDDDGSVVLVRQYRHPVGGELLEIPAGTREAGEDPLDCVRRELAEETGCAAGRIEWLVGFFTAPGFCTEQIDVYLATGLRAGVAHPEEDEGIEVVRLPLGEALARVERGEIRDAKSIIGLLLARERTEGRPRPA